VEQEGRQCVEETMRILLKKTKMIETNNYPYHSKKTVLSFYLHGFPCS
jgi:hypothetical protein